MLPIPVYVCPPNVLLAPVHPLVPSRAALPSVSRRDVRGANASSPRTSSPGTTPRGSSESASVTVCLLIFLTVWASPAPSSCCAFCSSSGRCDSRSREPSKYEPAGGTSPAGVGPADVTAVKSIIDGPRLKTGFACLRRASRAEEWSGPGTPGRASS